MITAVDEHILYFIAEYFDRNDYPPSVREIGEAVGLQSTSTVHAHLLKLRRHGLINWKATQPRTIRIKR